LPCRGAGPREPASVGCRPPVTSWLSDPIGRCISRVGGVILGGGYDLRCALGGEAYPHRWTCAWPMRTLVQICWAAVQCSHGLGRSLPTVRRVFHGSWSGGCCVVHLCFCMGQSSSCKSYVMFVWLISHQASVLFSQNKPVISNQPILPFSQNKSTPDINHQPNEQTDRSKEHSWIFDSFFSK
jgi:hypothetical protein